MTDGKAYLHDSLGKVFLYLGISMWLMDKQTSMAGSKAYLYVAGDKSSV